MASGKASPHASCSGASRDSSPVDAKRDWGQEEKGTTEDEMTGWHHRISGRELE